MKLAGLITMKRSATDINLGQGPTPLQSSASGPVEDLFTACGCIRGADELKHRKAPRHQENEPPPRPDRVSQPSSSALRCLSPSPNGPIPQGPPKTPPRSLPGWAEICTVEEAREEAMLGSGTATARRKASSAFQTIRRAPSKAEVRHRPEVGRERRSVRGGVEHDGNRSRKEGKIVATTRGVALRAFEKCTRRSRFCEETGSGQSGKCSPAGLAGDSWWALGFREGAEQA